MIQSPLLTSLMALCIFSLFSLVMLGQRYTTPIVTVVCPVTNLHHIIIIIIIYTTYIAPYIWPHYNLLPRVTVLHMLV